MEDCANTSHKDYQRIQHALQYLAANYRSQPDLAELASEVHLSEAHFQKMFKRWAGVSPKQFLQYLTVEHAQRCLREDMSVLETTYDSGLSAPARLNELFVRMESVTPAEYKNNGAGIEIDYGFHSTPFGDCLIGVSQRGVTGLAFTGSGDEDNRDAALNSMMKRLAGASYTHNPDHTASFCELIFTAPEKPSSAQTLSVLVNGTAFQVRVWEALLRIPAGGRSSYRQLAEMAGNPAASRAVGTAVGNNPVAVLIPCHRVIREDGMLGGYHWGLERKLALLGVESLQRHGTGVMSTGSVL